MCETVCEYGATGKPIIDCERYKRLEAELAKHVANNLVSIDRIHGLQAELKRKYKGCCDDCFVVTEPQKENVKLKIRIGELEKEIAGWGEK